MSRTRLVDLAADDGGEIASIIGFQRCRAEDQVLCAACGRFARWVGAVIGGVEIYEKIEADSYCGKRIRKLASARRAAIVDFEIQTRRDRRRSSSRLNAARGAAADVEDGCQWRPGWYGLRPPTRSRASSTITERRNFPARAQRTRRRRRRDGDIARGERHGRFHPCHSEDAPQAQTRLHTRCGYGFSDVQCNIVARLASLAPRNDTH